MPQSGQATIYFRRGESFGLDMARSIPEKDPKAVAELVRRAKEARSHLPNIVRQIEDLVRRVDPIELLSQLTLLFQTHPVNEQPNRDKAAAWQVRIEWLSWLVFSRRLSAPPQPELIGATILDPLERLLDQYVFTVTTTLPEPVEGLSDDQDEIRSLIQLEAIHVRGEAFQSQLERMATDLYSPHEEWCIANLGFTVQDAYAVAKVISERLGEQMHELRKAGEDIRSRLRAEPAFALTLDLPPVIRDALSDGLPVSGLEAFAESVGMAWFLAKSPEIVGFTLDALQELLAGQMGPQRVAAFLDFASVAAEDVHGEPDLLALPPVAKRPLIRHGGRFYLFVPGVFFEALFYGLHARLFADEDYRPRYDDARAEWLERSTVEAFRRILPNSESGWGLDYGPKKRRTEIDGLIRYDNKLILIECKWKNPTLLARSGDVVAALKDVDKAILQPLLQAKRARAYIRQEESAEFVERRTGRRIVVRRADVSEVFLVTIVGTGAWSLIAANLGRLAPLGLFSDGDYPWALSLNDLHVIADCLELPSQLFDYLRRREEAQRELRFRVHDEWDLLSVYLAGALDINDPRFADMDFVALDGFDSDLQDYYYSLSNPLVTAEKPRRPLPKNIRELLAAVESAHAPEKTDAICVVLRWPNWGLERLGESLEQARRKVLLERGAHAVAVQHPWRSAGVAFACGYRNRRAIQQVLWTACDSQREKMGATEFVGFGIDLAAPWDPIVLYYNRARTRQGKPDPEAQ
jgi:hypothetical protein